MKLDAEYWNHRYKNQRTGWDIGHANHGLVEEVKSRFPKSTKILIPGAGRAHEAEALWQAGFLNTYVCDWAQEAFTDLRTSKVLAKAFSSTEDINARLIVEDFFKVEDAFDLILEQTFFCAIDPSKRESYVEQAFSLLKPVGKWMGIFFDCHFPTEGPPFGGDKETYVRLFSKRFEVVELNRFDRSIVPRQGKELLGLMYCKSM